jgi:tetratricopeptide (TPR) repeat protein
MNCKIISIAILISFWLILPVMAANTSDQLNSAGALYSKSVDLANAGNYTGALVASDEALALNETAWVPLIQANRAGILVQLGRYDEAIIAADKALAIKANTTNAFAVAYSNKGDALRHLGRIEEAKAAFAKAYELDNSLVPPDLSSSLTSPTPTRSPLIWFTAPVAIVLVSCISCFCRRNRK